MAIIDIISSNLFPFFVNFGNRRKPIGPKFVETLVLRNDGHHNFCPKIANEERRMLRTVVVIQHPIPDRLNLWPLFLRDAGKCL